VFNRLTRAGSTALAAGRAVEAVEALGEAVALWRGSAAEDVCRSAALDRWLTALDEQRLATIEDWVEARQMLSDDGGLVGDLRRLTGDYPLRERMWRGLVLALYRAGDVSGALAAFRQARQAIVEDLGVEPGPELTWLHEAVLARDPALDGRARSAPSDGAESGGASPTRMTIHLELDSVDLADVTERLTLAFGDLALGRRPAEGGLR
jgi:DNA-binding SARP family transcriptional activator